MIDQIFLSWLSGIAVTCQHCYASDWGWVPGSTSGRTSQPKKCTLQGQDNWGNWGFPGVMKLWMAWEVLPWLVKCQELVVEVFIWSGLFHPTMVSLMTSSNANIFHITGPLSITGEFPSQRPVTWSFDIFFDLHLNKQLSKQLWVGWFETPWHSLWCHFNVQCAHSPKQSKFKPKMANKCNPKEGPVMKHNNRQQASPHRSPLT